MAELTIREASDLIDHLKSIEPSRDANPERELRVLWSEFGSQGPAAASTPLRHWDSYLAAAAHFGQWYECDLPAHRSAVEAYNHGVASRNAARAGEVRRRERARDEQLAQLKKKLAAVEERHPGLSPHRPLVQSATAGRAVHGRS